jgi:hypothetical protein
MPPTRHPTIVVNGRRLDPAMRQHLTSHSHLESGEYWYDPHSGLYGRHGEEPQGFLPEGMPMGEPSADCSGLMSGTRINGRCIGQRESQALGSGKALEPGHYRFDPTGNLTRLRGVWLWAAGRGHRAGISDRLSQRSDLGAARRMDRRKT